MRIIAAIIAVTALCGPANAMFEQGPLYQEGVHVFRLSFSATQRICGAKVSACTQRWGEGTDCNIFVTREVANESLIARGIAKCEIPYVDEPLTSETLLLDAR